MINRPTLCLARAFAGLLLAGQLTCAAEVHRVVSIRSNDVVAIIGGGDTAAAGFTGHLESLLAVRHPGARFRNFGWEGDTVFAQPRDVGFSSLAEQLKRAGATVVFVQFGRTEALGDEKSVPEFYAACEQLVSTCAQQTPRIVLVTPPPLESGGGPLPDLTKRNAKLAAHANAMRALAQRQSLHLIDLFKSFGGTSQTAPRLTDNGLQLTPRGHALVAAAFARELGSDDLAILAGDADANGAWRHAGLEKLRQAAMEKNTLWFHYWRPQNWAFLGGDRVTQPSSRDHRDPHVRWFPAEMEKYLPLIRAKEEEMEKAAAPIRGGAR